MEKIKLFFVRVLMIILPVFLVGLMFGSVVFSTHTSTASVREVEVDVTPQKLESLKASVVDRLLQCESAGHTEDSAVIIFDSNNQASVGQLQFQIKTVQHYVKKFEGRDISRKEAVLLALDTSKARELATKIIFEEQGGLWNWLNCANKLNLGPEVTVLKKLAQ